jgi:hypothetical protein
MEGQTDGATGFIILIIYLQFPMLIIWIMVTKLPLFFQYVALRGGLIMKPMMILSIYVQMMNGGTTQNQ